MKSEKKIDITNWKYDKFEQKVNALIIKDGALNLYFMLYVIEKNHHKKLVDYITNMQKFIQVQEHLNNICIVILFNCT